jgi:dTDP-4-amino-4,6-dideoxy-D-galactose acyltransferase
MIAEILSWDSDFFGQKIARACISRLNKQDMSKLLDWCQVNAVDCLYFLSDAKHTSTRELLQKSNFMLTDVRMVYMLDIIEPSTFTTDIEIIIAKPEHQDELCRIAAHAHYDSRFFADNGFNDEDCRRLYSQWIINSFKDKNQIILTPMIDKKPSGYLILGYDQNTKKGNILLFALASHVRGKGIGSALLSAGINWFFKAGSREIKVVTQGCNIASQRCYQIGGFLLHDVGFWFHKWFNRSNF